MIRQARPRRPSRWRQGLDPRLVIGVAIVIASVLGVVAIVRTADRTVDVYATAEALTPGTRIESVDLVIRQVALGAAESHYLRGGSLPDSGVVVTRTVQAGELVPAAALGEASSDEHTAVVVPLAAPPSRTVDAGGEVELWSAPAARAGDDAAPPSVLVSAATVVGLIDDQSLVRGASSVEIELLVPRAQLAAVLQAVAADAPLAVVPLALPLER